MMAIDDYAALNKDLIEKKDGSYLVPKALEPFTYDADGNMLTDSSWTNEWDSENRLVRQVNAAGTQKLEYAYDYQNRRVSKKVYNITTTPEGATLQLTKSEKFVYNGFYQIASFDANNAMQKSYLRAGSNLLSLTDHVNPATYFYMLDGNKNVMALVDASGTIKAEYVYDLFGRITLKSGDYADANPFRFSSEFFDDETGMSYYIHRYLKEGRWISRDPAEEDMGGVNLYALVGNDPINNTDEFGLWTRDEWKGEIGPNFKGTACAESDEDTLQQLSKLILGTGDAGVGARTVSKGETVEIAPYLEKLEKKLRENIAKAAKRGVNGRFPLLDDGTVIPYDDYPSLTIPGNELQNWFNGKRRDLGIDCEGAARVTLAKGLLDTIGKKDYEALFNSNKLPIYARRAEMGSTKEGDWLYFLNDKRYPDFVEKYGKPSDGGYRGENVIKVGSDSYIGFPINGARSERQWNTALINAFNGLNKDVQIKIVPGYNNVAQFFEVNVVGMKVFDLRKNRGQ